MQLQYSDLWLEKKLTNLKWFIEVLLKIYSARGYLESSMLDNVFLFPTLSAQ